MYRAALRVALYKENRVKALQKTNVKRELLGKNFQYMR